MKTKKACVPASPAVFQLADHMSRLIAGQQMPPVDSPEFAELTRVLHQLRERPEERDFEMLGKQCLGALLEVRQACLDARKGDAK